MDVASGGQAPASGGLRMGDSRDVVARSPDFWRSIPSTSFMALSANRVTLRGRFVVGGNNLEMRCGCRLWEISADGVVEHESGGGNQQ